MERIGSNIKKTPAVIAIIAKVRKHYGGAVKQHLIMARAQEIGLSVLDGDPALLIDNDDTTDSEGK